MKVCCAAVTAHREAMQAVIGIISRLFLCIWDLISAATLDNVHVAGVRHIIGMRVIRPRVNLTVS